MMNDVEEWKVCELPEEMRKWIMGEFEKMKNKPSYVVENMMKRRMIPPIPMEGDKYGNIRK